MALVFDIETAGESWDSFDETTRANLSWWLKESSRTETEYAYELKELQEGLGLSPLTGRIVAIGAYDTDTERGTVWYDAPSGSIEQTEGSMTYRRVAERQMLAEFWKMAKGYRTFISFNGRAFDAPFLALRSLALSVRPSKDLLSNRYLSSQRGATHIDLLDQLTFYGAARFRGKSLHLFCRAFGIESPKASGTTGEDVTALFRAGEGLAIARYNAGDLRATAALYRRWKEMMAE